jgi:hypothetical protein
MRQAHPRLTSLPRRAPQRTGTKPSLACSATHLPSFVFRVEYPIAPPAKELDALPPQPATWPVPGCPRVVDGVVQPDSADPVRQERFFLRSPTPNPYPRVSVRNTLLTIFHPACVRFSTR